MIDLIYNNYNLPILQLMLIVIAYTLVVFISLTLHELAHAFVAYKFGDDTAKLSGRLTLNPLKHIDLYGTISFFLIGFGWAKPVPINPIKFRKYKKGIFWVSFAGIISNLILGFFFSICSHFLSLIYSLNWFLFFLYVFCLYGTSLNFALALFNLIPIYPLDGFNMLSAYTKYDNKIVNFLRKYGQLILIILIISSVFSLILSYSVGNIVLYLDKFWTIIFGI